jgi:hypothetical protein
MLAIVVYTIVSHRLRREFPNWGLTGRM